MENHICENKVIRIPFPSIKRYPEYLRILNTLKEKGDQWVSATLLADQLLLKPIQVRKDIALTGIIGTPKKGFPLNPLIAALRTTLGWDNRTDAVLVGVGNLGSALLGYNGFSSYGLNIIAGFDVDQEKEGQILHGKTIYSLSKLPDLIKRMNISLGILTVPAEYAQDTADQLISYGIAGLWNFSATKLTVPPHIIVQKVDLAASLAVLSSRLLNIQE